MNWPTPIAAGRVSDDPPLVNLTTLPPTVKRGVWGAISAERPELAALLQSADFRAAVQRFEASVSVEYEDLPQAAIEIINKSERSAA